VLFIYTDYIDAEEEAKCDMAFLYGTTVHKGDRLKTLL
jgi:hypothetical protein